MKLKSLFLTIVIFVVILMTYYFASRLIMNKSNKQQLLELEKQNKDLEKAEVYEFIPVEVDGKYLTDDIMTSLLLEIKLNLGKK